jgi:hypothetical protein
VGLFVLFFAVSAVGVETITLEYELAQKYASPEAHDSGVGVAKDAVCSGGLILDDGTSEILIAQVGSNAGVVQRFELLPFPTRIRSVCIYYTSTSGQAQDINVIFYDTTGPGGAPGNLLASVTVQAPAQSIGSYREFVLGDSAPVLETEQVYIGALQNSDGSLLFFGNDQSAGTPQRAIYVTSDGVSFGAASGLWSDTKAVMIRASEEAVCYETVLGRLDGSSPKWNRITSDSSVNLNCEKIPQDSSLDDQPYNAIPIRSATGGLFTAIINKQGAGIGDTVMALYCDPFEADNPTANLIAYDDDGGDGELSGFFAYDNITLAANTRYWLVVTTFNSAQTGAYSLCLGQGWEREDLCAATINENLGPASPHYNRRIAGIGNPVTCSVVSADAAQNNMPYVAIPFRANTTGYFEAEIFAAGTTVADPVMSLYCNPFDPDNPAANLVAYDDNDGGNNLPAFLNSDAIVLTPGSTYWLVVSTWLGNDADGGNFRLCMRGDLAVWYPEETCSPSAMFGNRPAQPYESFNAFNSNTNNPNYVVAPFSGLSSPIRTVEWYALPIAVPPPNACDNPPTEFIINFFTDAAGAPGLQVAVETLTAQRSFTGRVFDASGTPYSEMKYTAELSAPVELGTGWIGIRSVGETNCGNYWLTSPASVSNSGFITQDGSNFSLSVFRTAFCLLPFSVSLHSADTNSDNVISLSELLRVIQFFNSNGLHCDAGGEDGFAPGPGSTACAPHAADYAPQDWQISLSELLRIIQFFNSGGYHPCAEGEDGFCPGPA